MLFPLISKKFSDDDINKENEKIKKMLSEKTHIVFEIKSNTPLVLMSVRSIITQSNERQSDDPHHPIINTKVELPPFLVNAKNNVYSVHEHNSLEGHNERGLLWETRQEIRVTDKTRFLALLMKLPSSVQNEKECGQNHIRRSKL